MKPDRGSGDRRLRSCRVANDLVAAGVGFALARGLDSILRAHGLLDTNAIPAAEVAAMATSYGILTVALGFRTGAYARGSSVLEFVEIRAGLRAAAIAAAVAFGLLFLLGAGDRVSRILFLSGIVLSAMTLVLGRRLLAVTLRGSGVWRRYAGRTLIVGGGPTARLLMKKIVQTPASGLEVVGFVADYQPVGSTVSCRLRQGETEPFDVPVLGRTWQITDLLARHPVSTVLVATGEVPREVLDDIVRAADAAGVDVGLVPEPGPTRVDIARMDDIAAIPVLRRQPLEAKRVHDLVKRLMDLLIAAPMLLLLSPLLAAVAIAVRIDSPGPALFRQTRIGRRGAAFTMLKFRTMHQDAEIFSRSPSTERDPRITRVGRLLRVAGIDELPQLLNVIQGEMSMVGPRPEMPFIVESYSDLEKERLAVKPGITGLWQLSPDRDVQIHENLEYDLYYVRNRSSLLDLVILLETALFTVALTWRRLFGRERSWGRSRRVRPVPAGVPVEEDDGTFVLVALDQRAEAAAPAAWARLATTVLAAGAGFVKVLVAPHHVPRLSGLGDGRADGAAAPEPRLEFVPYRTAAELYSWTDAASTVVTDLEHVRDQAVRRCVDVVFLGAGAARVLASTDAPGSLARRLGRALTELRPTA